MRKTKRLGKSIAIGIGAVALLVSTYAVPALASDTSYLDLRISGQGHDYSHFQNANRDNGDWQIDLDPDYDRPEVVLKAFLQNSNGVERGRMEVYEGTSNTAGSDCTSYYDYRIFGIRQYPWDDYVTVQGHWDLNY